MQRMLCISILLITFASYASAVRIMLTLIGPSNSSTNVTIAAAGAATKNCLTDIDVTSDAQYVFRVLDGGTTIYQVALSSGAGLVRSWNENVPICGGNNTATYLNVNAGNFNISYSGFTGP